MKPPGKAFRISIFFSIPAIVAIFLASPTCEDEALVQQPNPFGLPLHILSEEKIVETFRAMGYAKSSASFQYLHVLVSGMLDRSDTPQFAYIASEVLWRSELLMKANRNPYRLRFYQAIFRDSETKREAGLAYKLFLRWFAALYDEKDPSPKTAEMIRKDIAIYERMGLGAFMGQTYEGLADYYLLIHEDEQALRCMEEGVARHIESGHISALSHLTGRIGIYHLMKGDIAEAETTLLQSYEYARVNDDPFFLSRSLAFLSELRAKQGHFADAESLLVQSIDYSRRMNDPATELCRFADLANLYVAFGEYDRAEAAIEKAISLDRKQSDRVGSTYRILDRNRAAYYLAKCLALRAAIRLSTGETNEAVKTMRRALATARHSADWSFEADLMKQLGDACASAGDDKEAVRCYAKACSNAKKRRELGKEAEYLTAAGGLYLDRKEYSRAEDYLMRAAGLAEAPPCWMQRVRALHLLARAKIGLNERGEARRLLNESIATFERELAGKRFAEDRHALSEEMRSIFSDLLTLESDDSGSCDSLLFAAEKARHLWYGEKGIRAKDLAANIERCIGEREWIPENALIVQYLVTPGKLIIAVMNRNGATYRSVPVTREKLEEEIGAFVAACGAAEDPGTAPDGAASSREIEERARSLYRTLVEPIERFVSEKETICFISDESLRRLPFGALLPPGPDGRFLVESKRILTNSNLLALRAAATSARAPFPAGRSGSSLLVGRPEIGACLARNYPGLRALPGAQDELIDIRDIIGGATILAGPLATKKSVLAELPNADQIHIATHRVTYPAYSGRSALLFSTDSDCKVSHEVEASLLTESEIRRLNLSRARLVVLSACESATGEESAASEGLGLAGAFIEAGAQRVVATIWPVEDRAARDFVTAFYHELVTKKGDPGTALQTAQKKIIQKNRSNGSQARDIRAWAPYLVIGSL
jgi:CHAT domain-containing protein/tetratricopeptide (TPR) repeat protein